MATRIRNTGTILTSRTGKHTEHTFVAIDKINSKGKTKGSLLLHNKAFGLRYLVNTYTCGYDSYSRFPERLERWVENYKIEPITHDKVLPLAFLT